ncbi:hypothetical protein Hdeb2414_s0013g00403241 [Helianthus debilis subsp. tardiflorus]
MYGFNYLFIYLFVYIKSTLLVYHIKSILTQSCVKIMVHKFMSYLGVPLNDSFNIDQTSCDIHCFHSSIVKKNVIPLFHFQLKIL